MKILLVNDDGFDSEGINILDRELSKRGHEVWMCAPNTQRSACSHAVRLKNVKISKICDRHYTCDGFPADCVLYSVLGAIPMGTPDLVISGINQGFNLSTDRVYSGTIGAAEEAALKNIPAIAVSCESVVKDSESDQYPKKRHFENFPFEDAAKFIVEHMQEFHDECKPGYFFNVNVPDKSNGKWCYTTTGTVDFGDTVRQCEEPDTFYIEGAVFPGYSAEKIEDADFFAVFAKRLISVTIMREGNV